MTQFHIGDIVHLAADSAFSEEVKSHTYKIEKVPAGRTGVNYVAQPTDGSWRGIRAPERCLVIGPVPALHVPYQPPLEPGTLATFKGHDGLWVVTGNTAKGNRIFPLGGSMRYYTSIPNSKLTVIDPKRVTIAPEGTP
jgi:hypothetical protein